MWTSPIRIRSAIAAAALAFFGSRASAQADPLPSWADNDVKREIVSFVRRVTTRGSADFVPPADRIATFDNDGTLWVEMPMPTELIFALGLAHRPLDDAKTLVDDPRALMALVGRAEGAMTEEQFRFLSSQFLDSARHPTLKKPFTSLVYQPMLELMRYLRANGFETWISSGGSTDFMRAYSDSVYGIPAKQVIGSEAKSDSRMVGGRRVVWRLPQLEPLNDQALKPVHIGEQIGKRPILAAGNVRSAGDVEMLEYSKTRLGPSLQLLVHHDDPVREFKYDEKDNASLDAAARFGFTVVSMKRDWKVIFPQ